VPKRASAQPQRLNRSDGSVYLNALRAGAANGGQLHVIECLLFSPGEHDDVAIEVRHASFVRLHFPNSAFQIDKSASRIGKNAYLISNLESRHGLNIVTSKHVNRMYGIVRENHTGLELCRRFETCLMLQVCQFVPCPEASMCNGVHTADTAGIPHLL
jgi:hypothetical protein